MKKLVSADGHRWAIEDTFEAAKNESSSIHNETRSRHGWHRHASLVMFAFAMMTVIRRHANAGHPKKHFGLSGPNLPDPFVDLGNPPHCNQARAATHPGCPPHRMVALAPYPSSQRPHQTEKRNSNARQKHLRHIKRHC
jgi:hypothetical protein